MFTKVRQILGKIFLSGASFFWVSCDSASSAEEPGPLIDIEQEMAKLTPPDTSGLRGQCISAYTYCNAIDNYYANEENRMKAHSIAKEKIDTLFKSNKISKAKYNCYNNKLNPSLMMPEYGPPPCDDLYYLTEWHREYIYPTSNEDSLITQTLESSRNEYQHFVKKHNLTECDPVTDGVLIDDHYFNIVTENDEYDRSIIRKELEKINEHATKCDSID